MDPVEKAAIFLLSLDKPLAAEVMSQLPKSMVEAVTLKIAQLSEVPREKQESVFDEFEAIADEGGGMERGGLDFANDLLQQSLGSDGANAILENVRQSMSSVPFAFLTKVGVDNLLTFIAEEHPQTIALVLSHANPQLAAEVLAGLPPDKQIEVIRRIASMEQTSPGVVRDVEASLENRMKSTFSQQTEKAGGVPAVAQILNVADRATNKGIMESLEQENPEMVEEIRRLMFVFEDILKLSDKAIQTLLKEVEYSQWATALKGASEEIKQKIMGNLSQRAAESLKEDMEYLGPVRVSDVEAMQQQIVDTIRKLEDAGEIDVSGGDADEFIA
ncbi:MAG: flagellar motor switch protein FliG [Planctomycetaceae bacterium]